MADYKNIEPEITNIERKSLVDPRMVLRPPLQIKLGLMKQFVKALPKEGECLITFETSSLVYLKQFEGGYFCWTRYQKNYDRLNFSDKNEGK